MTHDYHWKTGWWFRRGPDGGVQIQHWKTPADKDTGQPPEVDLAIPAAEWASIVAAVSRGGEQLSYEDAWNVHAGNNL